MHLLTAFILNILFAFWFFVRLTFGMVVAVPMTIVIVVVGAWHLFTHRNH